MRAMGLSPRGREVLCLLAGFRFLTRRQLERMVLDGDETLQPLSKEVICRRVVLGLTRQGLVTATRRIIGGPGGGSSALVHWLTPAGLRVAAELDPTLEGRGKPTSGSFLLQHSLVTADVALAFRRSARDNPDHEVMDWESDWQIAARLAGTRVKPDARVVYGTAGESLEALVEVDLGTEGSLAWQKKLGRYFDLFRHQGWVGHLPFWPAILVITPTDHRARFLLRATKEHLEAQSDAGLLLEGTEFLLTALPDLVSRGPLAAIWRSTKRDGLSELFEPVSYKIEGEAHDAEVD